MRSNKLIMATLAAAAMSSAASAVAPTRSVYPLEAVLKGHKPKAKPVKDLATQKRRKANKKASKQRHS